MPSADGLVVWNGRKIRSRSAPSRPMPLSSTVTMIIPSGVTLVSMSSIRSPGLAHFHGRQGVRDEVQHHVLQLAMIAVNHQHVDQREAQLDAVGLQARPGQRRDFADDLGDVDDGLDRRRIAQQVAVAPQQLVRAMAGVDDVVEGGDDFVGIRSAAKHPQAGFRICDDRRERLTHFVRHRRGEIAHHEVA